ncbi:MAG TPA: NrdH-redoxin [Bacteroidales bacterium]|nr:NrdH-redoxin [Bacteroidales bacterium]
MESVSSYIDVQTKLKDKGKLLLLIYKSGHGESECAYQNLEAVLKKDNSIPAFYADVNDVLDIHPKYGVTKVPSLIILDSGRSEKVIEGCKNDSRYKVLFTKSFGKTKNNSPKDKIKKQVVVYSTPTCGWCVSLKRWLDDNRIAYIDTDISKDEKAAQSLIKLTGHTGVPQIKIDKEIVVGFQLPRLKELLEIK